MSLFDMRELEPQRQEVAPGAWLVRNWLSLELQRHLVSEFKKWTEGPVPLRGPIVRGHEMSAKSVGLGWHWSPYKYSREALDINGNQVLDFPDWMVTLGREALSASGISGETYLPDVAIANYYDDNARMGMHQDKDERSLDPVVSLSIGNACQFRFGNTQTRTKPYKTFDLFSGDLFVFGGPSRLAFHGVMKIYPNTAPAHCGLEHGRLNLTMRVTGLND